MTKLKKLLYVSIILLIVTGTKIPYEVYMMLIGMYCAFSICYLLTMAALIIVYDNNKTYFDERSKRNSIIPDLKGMLAKSDGKVVTLTEVLKISIVVSCSVVLSLLLPRLLPNLFK